MGPWLAGGCAVLAGCGARSALYAPDLGGGGGSGGSPSTGTPVYCDHAGPTSVFVVTDASQLYSFDPPSGTFTFVSTLACPSSSSPETMAVDHAGTAYVTYADGTMFAVDLASQSCAPTAFSDGPNDDRFGSCFASNAGGKDETFFLMDSEAPGLFTVDTTTFAVTEVGSVSSCVGNSELTGTGDGRLFAFGSASGSCQGFLAQLDPTTAAVLDQMPVPLPMNTGFAFAFWGGDFYFFTGDDSGDSTVARLVPGGALDPSYATLSGAVIVGAGVSTCAPVH